jgi:hypothetical protein
MTWAVAETVTVTAVDAADCVRTGPVAFAVSVCVPAERPATVTLNVPLLAAVAVPTRVLPSNTATLELGSAPPLTVSELGTVSFVRGLTMTGGFETYLRVFPFWSRIRTS